MAYAFDITSCGMFSLVGEVSPPWPNVLLINCYAAEAWAVPAVLPKQMFVWHHLKLLCSKNCHRVFIVASCS